MPRRRRVRLALGLSIAGLLMACAGPGADLRRPDEGASPPALTLSRPRAVHQATRLLDGRVLVTGGCTEPGCGGFVAAQTSEIYEPGRGRFTAGPRTSVPRASGTATLLADGRVLLAGGYPGEGQPPLASLEVFDPARSTFASFGTLRVPRADHSATLLPDGAVLIAGGAGVGGQALSSTELVRPTGVVEPGPDLGHARTGHVGIAVGPRILLVGGAVGGSALRSTEIGDGNEWAPGPDLRSARVKHAALVLSDGRVLVIGGSPTTEGRERLASTEILSADLTTTSAGPDLAEGQYKLSGAAVALADGRAVVAGGPRVEVIDPARGSTTAVEADAQPARSFVTATLVAPDTLLVAGGYDGGIVPSAGARLVRW